MTTLFKDEKVITTTDSNIIILTTHRVRYNSRGSWDNKGTTSIMLEKISSIQTTYVSYPTLLVIASLLLLGALFVGSRGTSQEVGVVIFFAIVFFTAYFATRRQACIISSDGGAKIAFGTNNMDKELISEFIDKVESAKVERVKAVLI